MLKCRNAEISFGSWHPLSTWQRQWWNALKAQCGLYFWKAGGFVGQPDQTREGVNLILKRSCYIFSYNYILFHWTVVSCVQCQRICINIYMLRQKCLILYVSLNINLNCCEITHWSGDQIGWAIFPPCPQPAPVQSHIWKSLNACKDLGIFTLAMGGNMFLHPVSVSQGAKGDN